MNTISIEADAGETDLIGQLIAMVEDEQQTRGTQYLSISADNLAFLKAAAERPAAPRPQRPKMPTAEPAPASASPVAPTPNAYPTESPRPPLRVQEPKPTPAPEAKPPAVVASNGDIAKANSLDELSQLLEQESACGSCQGIDGRTLGAGNANAQLMIIGGAPSPDDLRQGSPCGGAAGELLEKIIQAMHITMSDVYLTNCCKCRPTTLDGEEPPACFSYVKRQIELVQPSALILLSALPLRWLLQLQPLSQHRGQWLSYQGIPCIATHHPSYLLRMPKAKREVWSDVQQVMARLGTTQ